MKTRKPLLEKSRKHAAFAMENREKHQRPHIAGSHIDVHTLAESLETRIERLEFHFDDPDGRGRVQKVEKEFGDQGRVWKLEKVLFLAFGVGTGVGFVFGTAVTILTLANMFFQK